MKKKKKEVYNGTERREFVRLDYITPVSYKVCKKKTVSKLFEGYTANISQNGLFCNIKGKVNKNDIIWLAFDRATLNICGEIDKRNLIYQNGVLGKVVRIKHKKDDNYNVGVQFVTREEKNLTNIFPKTYFMKDEEK